MIVLNITIVVVRDKAANKEQTAMAEDHKEYSRAERDGEDARLRGELSVLNRSWSPEAGRKWGEAFLAREALRANSLTSKRRSRTQKKRMRAMLLTLRRELNATCHCVYCGTLRQRTDETDRAWASRDDCTTCREKKMRPGILDVMYCRYCGVKRRRAEVLSGGKPVQTWTSSNKCTGCANVRKNLEATVVDLLKEHLRSQ